MAAGNEHHIEMGSHCPITHKCRRLPYAVREKVDAKIQSDVQAGKLVPSNSPWAAPIVAVKKPDGQIRVCGDYTDLNNITVKDAYPLKHCRDLLDSAWKTKPRFFSTLDLRSGYHQIWMSEDLKAKTAIICPS
ncbi:MAG: RNA-directed DNA polymerase [Gammaproteobacteria bacterium]|nr:RNA-directed DNA polymerase [Gammaproteobacteria bacterium]